jgi:hypothetical protein
MACYNGQTFVNTCIAAPGATAADATYVVDLTHYLCGNRKLCANGAYPLAADLSFKVLNPPRAVGNDTYQVDILITGDVTYMPYRNGQGNCGCDCNCPRSENIYATVSVPWGAADAPVVTAGEAFASPTNMRDCCSITNACSIVGSFNLATAAGASAGGSKGK